jgi:phosphate transport system protein
MGELRKQFHHELDSICQELTRIGASVVEEVSRATQILLDQDLEGADYLIRSDDEIDARCLDLEERCLDLLARQQPVASDLRRIMSVFQIIGELERSADLCVNICKGARRIYPHSLSPTLRGLIQRMGEQGRFLMAAAVEAFADSDAAKASALDDMDSQLDALQRELIQAIFRSHEKEHLDVNIAVQLAMIARFFERIGDHAVNIGERVRYMVTGRLPEHVSVEQFRANDAETTESRDSAGADHVVEAGDA